LGILLIGLLGFFLVAEPGNRHDQTFAQDKVLVSAATDLHPTDVFSVTHSANSLQEAFQAAGIAFHPEDKISYFPDPRLGLNTVITVQHALPITLVDGKHTTTIRTWASNVGDLLTEKKIELGQDDRISPTLTTPLAKNTTITIIRVAVTEITTNSIIPFGITKKNDNTLDEGKTRIDKPGVSGTLASTFRVTREDGTEVSRVLLSTAVVVAPQDQLLIIGTKPVITVPCRFNDWVLDAAIKNGQSANGLCYRMMRESNGNPNSDGILHKGLFQYDPGFWSAVSAKAGYPGASIWDAKSQIYVTAWAWANGYRGRWPNP